MPVHAQTHTLDESDSLVADLATIIRYPEDWLDTPNDRFGGQPPRVLLQTAEGRAILYNLVQNVKYGMMT
jgi:hypothetical protein